MEREILCWSFTRDPVLRSQVRELLCFIEYETGSKNRHINTQYDPTTTTTRPTGVFYLLLHPNIHAIVLPYFNSSSLVVILTVISSHIRLLIPASLLSPR